MAVDPIRGTPDTRDTSQPAVVTASGLFPRIRNVNAAIVNAATAVDATTGNSRILHGKNVQALLGTIAGNRGAGESCRNFPSNASSFWISGSGSPDRSHK